MFPRVYSALCASVPLPDPHQPHPYHQALSNPPFLHEYLFIPGVVGNAATEKVTVRVPVSHPSHGPRGRQGHVVMTAGRDNRAPWPGRQQRDSQRSTHGSCRKDIWRSSSITFGVTRSKLWGKGDRYSFPGRTNDSPNLVDISRPL